MIKEALEFLTGLKKPIVEIQEVNGRKYSVGAQLSPIHDPLPQSIGISNLAGVVDYLKSGRDGDHIKPDGVIVQVVSPTEVRVLSVLQGPFHQRATLLTAKFGGFKAFTFGEYIEREEMMIAIQARFAKSDGKDLIISQLSEIVDIGETKISDNTVTQTVQKRSGISLSIKVPGEIKNPYILAPFRSFPDIQQAESPFILRAEKSGDDIEFALFEADGGAWQVEAIERISKFLTEKLGEGYAVIS